MAPGVISPPKIGSDSLVTIVSSVAIIREINPKAYKSKKSSFWEFKKRRCLWDRFNVSDFRTNVSSAKIHKIWSMTYYKPYDISVLHL